MVHRTANMCGHAHGDGEDALECQVAAKDRSERRLCYRRGEPEYIFLQRSYRRLKATDFHQSLHYSSTVVIRACMFYRLESTICNQPSSTTTRYRPCPCHDPKSVFCDCSFVGFELPTCVGLEVPIVWKSRKSASSSSAVNPTSEVSF